MIIIVQFAINQYIFVNPRIFFIFNFKNGNARSSGNRTNIKTTVWATMVENKILDVGRALLEIEARSLVDRTSASLHSMECCKRWRICHNAPRLHLNECHVL